MGKLFLSHMWSDRMVGGNIYSHTRQKQQESDEKDVKLIRKLSSSPRRKNYLSLQPTFFLNFLSSQAGIHHRTLTANERSEKRLR